MTYKMIPFSSSYLCTINIHALGSVMTYKKILKFSLAENLSTLRPFDKLKASQSRGS